MSKWDRRTWMTAGVVAGGTYTALGRVASMPGNEVDMPQESTGKQSGERRVTGDSVAGEFGRQDELTADQRRVMAAGLTEAEADCWKKAADAAGAFFQLEELHPMDSQEVANAIHVIQNKLLGRPTYRKYLEIARAEEERP